MFHDFCAEIGVDSIREYEQEHLKHQAELDKKRYDMINTLRDKHLLGTKWRMSLHYCDFMRKYV